MSSLRQSILEKPQRGRRAKRNEKRLEKRRYSVVWRQENDDQPGHDRSESGDKYLGFRQEHQTQYETDHRRLPSRGPLEIRERGKD